MNRNQNLLKDAARRYLFLAQIFRSLAPADTDFQIFHGRTVFTPKAGMTELKNAVI